MPYVFNGAGPSPCQQMVGGYSKNLKSLNSTTTVIIIIIIIM